MNRRPTRLPLYEHHIDPTFISKVLEEELCSQNLKARELTAYYQKVTGFWKEMTYDGFGFEASICDIFPGHGDLFRDLIVKIGDCIFL